MNTKKRYIKNGFICCSIFIILSIFINFGFQMNSTALEAHARSIEKYEYKSVKFSFSRESDLGNYMKILNDMGSQGYLFDHNAVGRFLIFRKKL